MELEEIQALTLTGAKTPTVPVPAQLDEDLAAHPEEYGLPRGISARKARGLLLLEGAKAAKLAQRERARERMYERMTQDPEWQQARREAHAEAIEDRRF